MMKVLLGIVLIAVASGHQIVGHPDMIEEINSKQD